MWKEPLGICSSKSVRGVWGNTCSFLGRSVSKKGHNLFVNPLKPFTWKTFNRKRWACGRVLCTRALTYFSSKGGEKCSRSWLPVEINLQHDIWSKQETMELRCAAFPCTWSLRIWVSYAPSCTLDPLCMVLCKNYGIQLFQRMLYLYSFSLYLICYIQGNSRERGHFTAAKRSGDGLAISTFHSARCILILSFESTSSLLPRAKGFCICESSHRRIYNEIKLDCLFLRCR